MSGYRVQIVTVAALLVVWCMPPVRRRLPGVRRLPGSLEPALWIGLVALCLVALGAVQTRRSSQLAVSVLRAGFNVTGQAFASTFDPSIVWASHHQAGLAMFAAAATLLAAAGIAYGFTRAIARSHHPRPRLKDWWIVKGGRGTSHRRARSGADEAPALLDSRGAALYVGVSRTTLYRWVRAGELPCIREGVRMRFRPSDLTSMRRRMHREAEVAAMGATR